MSDWWLTVAEPRLSQGDIFDAVGLGMLTHPREVVKKHMFGGGARGWATGTDSDADHNGMLHMLAKGRIRGGIVVSHSCEIDKDERKGQILVCPVISTSTIQETAKNTIFSFRRVSMFPLPNVPGVGDAYADLRGIQPIARAAFDSLTKHASMTPTALARFHEHLVGFLARPPEQPAEA